MISMYSLVIAVLLIIIIVVLLIIKCKHMYYKYQHQVISTSTTNAFNGIATRSILRNGEIHETRKYCNIYKDVADGPTIRTTPIHDDWIQLSITFSGQDNILLPVRQNEFNSALNKSKDDNSRLNTRTLLQNIVDVYNWSNY